MSKRIISLLLVFSMLLSCSTAVFAQGEVVTDELTELEEWEAL